MLPELSVIKKLRKKAGLTQKQLARLTGLSQSYINKIENRIAEPPYNVAKRIIELLENNINKEFNVKSLMTKIRTINQNKRIRDAINLMSELGVSQLPVESEGLIVGSFTKKTIPRLIKKGVKNIDEQLIKDVMDSPFPMIPLDSSRKLITNLLEFNDAVLILDKGKFKGIITRHDLIKSLKKY